MEVVAQKKTNLEKSDNNLKWEKEVMWGEERK